MARTIPSMGSGSSGRPGCRTSARPASSNRRVEGRDPAFVDLDRLVPQPRDELGFLELEARDDRQRQCPGPAAVFADRERSGTIERLPRVRDGPRERPAEDRVRLGSRQEVAIAARPCPTRAVVAALGVVQGEGHEPRERDRTAVADLVSYQRDQLVVLSDALGVRRRVAAECPASRPSVGSRPARIARIRRAREAHHGGRLGVCGAARRVFILAPSLESSSRLMAQDRSMSCSALRE